MKVISVRSQIRELPKKLREAWQRPDGTWKRIVQREPDTEKIHAAVCALNLEVVPADEIIAAMGFDLSWVGTKCHECKKENCTVVQLGEELDYESHTADICLDCLRQAANDPDVLMA